MMQTVQATTEAHRPKRCAGCHATEAIAVFPLYGDDPLCPQCASERQAVDQAGEHLVSLIVGPLFHDWHSHWKARGLTPSLFRHVLEHDVTDELLRVFEEAYSGERP